MADRRFFVTSCPQCRGLGIGNVDHQAISQWHGIDYYKNNSSFIPPTIGAAEPIPCPLCDGRKKVIAQVMAPFVAEEQYS